MRVNKVRTHQTIRREGAVLVLVALFLPIAIILAGFAINVAYMELTRTELQVAVDAAARAAGRTLALTGDKAKALAAASEAASKNRVAGQPLTLDPNDVEFGRSTRNSTNSRYVFNTSTDYPNSVRILARRANGSPDGPVAMLFRPMIGVDQFEVSLGATSTQVEMDIALVLDRSGSMAFATNEKSSYGTPKSAPSGWDYCDPAPPKARWHGAVSATQAFLEHLELTAHVEQVGLATYNHDPALNVQLTSNYALIPAALDVYTQQFCFGTTNIGGGIETGHYLLINSPNSRPWATKAMVVMTDGMHNTGKDPVTAAKNAQKDGITIYTVTFSNEADVSRMKKVAEAGNGQHFHANTSKDLIDAFRMIAQTLPTLLTD